MFAKWFFTTGLCVLTKPCSSQEETEWKRGRSFYEEVTFLQTLVSKYVLTSHWPALGYMVTLGCNKAKFTTTLKLFSC